MVLRAWLWKHVTTLVHRTEGSPGHTTLTLGCVFSLRSWLFSVCVYQGSVSWVWGHGKAGRLGSHRPVAESPGGHLAPISRGGRGLPGAGPVAGWGQRLGVGCVCGMTQDP